MNKKEDNLGSLIYARELSIVRGLLTLPQPFLTLPQPGDIGQMVARQSRINR